MFFYLDIILRQPTSSASPNVLHKKATIDLAVKLSKTTFSSLNKSLLLRAGDVEANPGPTTKRDLCAIHLNARSFKPHQDLIEAESFQYDIITMSETWFSEADDVNCTSLTGFHPPVRRDRPHNNSYGGVAIYVKNNLYCKPRPDLLIDDLEAV